MRFLKRCLSACIVCVMMTSVSCGKNRIFNNDLEESEVSQSSKSSVQTMSDQEVMSYYADYLRTCGPIVCTYSRSYCGMVIRFTDVTDTGCTVEWDSFGNSTYNYSILRNYLINDCLYGSAHYDYRLIEDDDGYQKPCLVFEDLAFTYPAVNRDYLTTGYIRLSDWYGDFSFEATENPASATSGELRIKKYYPESYEIEGFYLASESPEQY